MLLPFPGKKKKSEKYNLINVAYEIVSLQKKQLVFLFFTLFIVNMLS